MYSQARLPLLTLRGVVSCLAAGAVQRPAGNQGLFKADPGIYFLLFMHYKN